AASGAPKPKSISVSLLVPPSPPLSQHTFNLNLNRRRRPRPTHRFARIAVSPNTASHPWPSSSPACCPVIHGRGAAAPSAAKAPPPSPLHRSWRGGNCSSGVAPPFFFLHQRPLSRSTPLSCPDSRPLQEKRWKEQEVEVSSLHMNNQELGS
uniref:Uncharacterized protein n=1 Tax=Triticum urartu TaxID=4572 RepID=A0A8R7QKQ4_TRIUA